MTEMIHCFRVMNYFRHNTTAARKRKDEMNGFLPVTREEMNKEVMVHIYNRILLSYKKEHIWVSSNEVDGIGAYYT